MIDYRSNDPRVELVMDQIYAALPADPFSEQQEEPHVMFSFTTQGSPGWGVSIRIKRPYTYVMVSHGNKEACAFGKVNWSDKFSLETGFAIVARKAIAAFYREG